MSGSEPARERWKQAFRAARVALKQPGVDRMALCDWPAYEYKALLTVEHRADVDYSVSGTPETRKAGLEMAKQIIDKILKEQKSAKLEQT